MEEQVLCNFIIPFTSDGNFDFKNIDQLLQLCENNCNDGLVLFSNQCEGVLLSKKEKYEITNYIIKKTKLKCYYSIYSNNKLEIIDEIKEISRIGISFFIISTPFLINVQQEEIYIFFKDIAKNIYPNKIILLSDIKRTGINLSFFTIKKLLKTRENIIGLIECSSDFNLIYLLKKNFKRFKVFIGIDKYLFEALKNNADGVVSVISIEYGKEIQSVIKDYKYGIVSEIQISYLKLISSLIEKYPSPCGIKFLVNKKEKIDLHVREPLIDINASNEEYDILL